MLQQKQQKDVEDAFGLAQNAIKAIAAKLGDTLGAMGLRGIIRTSLELDARTYTEKPEFELSVRSGVAYVGASKSSGRVE